MNLTTAELQENLAVARVALVDALGPAERLTARIDARYGAERTPAPYATSKAAAYLREANAWKAVRQIESRIDGLERAIARRTAA